jgi:hypothetical protein
MGKKDGKRVDKSKVEAKKAKQAAKQTKLVKKSVKKEIKELGEDDIEMMIAEVGDHSVYCTYNAHIILFSSSILMQLLTAKGSLRCAVCHVRYTISSLQS